jgi:hypothetical protein
MKTRDKIVSLIFRFWYILILLAVTYLFLVREEIRIDYQFFGEGIITYYTPGSTFSIREDYQKLGKNLPWNYISNSPNLLLPIQKLFRTPSATYWIKINGKGTLKMSITRNGKLCSEVNKEINGDERVEITCIPE